MVMVSVMVVIGMHIYSSIYIIVLAIKTSPKKSSLC